ncbi:hypothetical protein JL107_13840 [Nakamurella flavida]|uniref:WxL domain-containing protein n=1 Tax=Nakamurella flavida TaxID=363630 RepID=A0A939C6V1_9ACTN|nr:hypothetical protein [Nakamurella flavida]MBM9477527.1 hypothetical protein [Nakamurella flavida]MDP9777460.1 hypothetical protein [Nakamurella flavida]
MSSLFSAAPTVRSLLRTAVVGSAAAALVLGSAAVASAAPGDVSNTQDTQANVQVDGIIILSGLTPTFTLAGPSDQLATATVNYTVETNNPGGYSVTVIATAPNLLPADQSANPDVVPVSLITADDGTVAGGPLSDTVPLEVHNQGLRSAPGGDNLSTDYSVIIPLVNEDTYSGTLTYVATAL